MARSLSVFDKRGISNTALLVTEQNLTAVSYSQDIDLSIYTNSRDFLTSL